MLPDIHKDLEKRVEDLWWRLQVIMKHELTGRTVTQKELDEWCIVELEDCVEDLWRKEFP